MRQPLVKICGVTCRDDAAAAVAAGADLIGLNFWPQSKRAIPRELAVEVAGTVRLANPGTQLVGVFVNQSIAEIEGLVASVGLNWVQLHGDEPAEECEKVADGIGFFGARVIKAIPLASEADVAVVAGHPASALLVDTPSSGYGGSGQVGDWSLARAAVATGRPIFLAGGLTPENVAAAIAAVEPHAVDVASGVESEPGRKDVDAMRRFIAAVKGAR